MTLILKDKCIVDAILGVAYVQDYVGNNRIRFDENGKNFINCMEAAFVFSTIKEVNLLSCGHTAQSASSLSYCSHEDIAKKIPFVINLDGCEKPEQYKLICEQYLAIRLVIENTKGSFGIQLSRAIVFQELTKAKNKLASIIADHAIKDYNILPLIAEK